MPDIALPAPTSIAAAVDLQSRIAAFDGGENTLLVRAGEVWAIIEPDAPEIVEAYWSHWRLSNPGAP